MVWVVSGEICLGWGVGVPVGPCGRGCRGYALIIESFRKLQDSQRTMFGKITNGIIEKRHFRHERSPLLRPIVISAILKQVKVAVATLLNLTKGGGDGCLFTGNQHYLFLRLSVTPR